MKHVKRFFIILVCILVAMIFLPYLQHYDTYNDEDIIWMNQIDDHTPLSDMYIPGSHDAATYASDIPLFSSCQSFTLEQQLLSGARYLDIRVGNHKDEAVLVHGPMACRKSPLGQRITLLDALEVCETYLLNHPSETILFVSAVQDDASDIYTKTINDFKANSKVGIYEQATIPTLENVRGKIILGTRDYKENANYNNFVVTWKDQRDTKCKDNIFENGAIGQKNIKVQDHFCYEISDKFKAFEADPDAEFVINFLSTKGCKKVGHPYRYAKELNNKFLESEKDNYTKGIYVFDFGCDDVYQKVINMNR